MRAVRAMVGAAVLAAAVVVLAGAPAGADTITIDFEDAPAPDLFVETEPLTDAYADLGVTFAGPAPGSGGAILNDNTFGGLSGYSATNFLAFNTSVTAWPDGARPEGPETLTFDPPISDLTMVAAAFEEGELTIEAYDASDDLVDSDVVVIGPAAVELGVSAPGIVRVVVAFESQVVILDDLTFVQDGNGAPVADAGADQTVELGDEGVEVALDGSGSSDPDDDELTYTWTGGFKGGTADGATPVVTFTEAGTYEVTLEVSDGELTDTDSVTVTVTEPVPPSTTTSTTAPATPTTAPPTAPPAAAPAVATPTYVG